jgi:hypothetical protein
MRSKIIAIVLIASVVSFNSKAQDKEEKEKKGFNKENLFTGGSVSVAFYNNTFLVGGSPVFGYSITNWADLGIVVNYNYTSYRDYNYIFNDKLKQYVYGGGGFVKLYPVRFLFVQGQYEYNFIKQKLIRNVGTTSTVEVEAGSFLIGGGYTTGRFGRGGAPHFYLAVLFDISNNLYSPYTDGYGRTIPIIRGGVQIPLFQGGGRKN